MFIAKSGTGYFTGFSRTRGVFTPCFTPDPLSAKRIERDVAEWVITKMEEAGFGAELVELVRAGIDGYCYVVRPRDGDLREALAAYAHKAWSGWRRYVVAKSTLNQDGTMTVLAWAVARWGRQMNTEYADLSDEEKESDRAEADEMVAIMHKFSDPARLGDTNDLTSSN